jgi:type IV pilus assembly protein PilY1
MKKSFALLLCLTLLPLNVPLVRADDSDIFGANIEPNIMIFIDSSGSMDDYIDQASTAPYAPATTYPGTPSPPLPNKTAAKVYRCKSGKTIDNCENDPSLYVVYANTVADVTSTAARASLTTAGTWNGKIGGTNLQLRTGNYLNYHFSPMGGHERKIVVARRVVTNLINNTDGVRFGLSKFTGNESDMGPGGAVVIGDIGASKATLTTAVAGIAASGWTPSQGALYDIGKYYKGTYTGKTSPIQYECQPNFVIFMSDGLQNGYGDLRTEATLRWTQDHATSLPGTQKVQVDTVGFAVPAADADAANDVLLTAATNGGGHFYSTTSEAQLEAALEDSIRRIMAASFAFATPVIPTTSATGLSRAYLAAFQSDPSKPFWRGFLKAYNRGSDGNVPTDTNGVPLDTALAWEAGQKLTETAAGDRTIYTLIGGTRQSFSTANSNLTQGLLGVGSSAERDKVIGFLRGVDVLDENANGDATEDREWKLGDIFHSTPVVVTPPFIPSPDLSYQAFRAAQASRTTVVIAGANDGMLHAFRETDGVELWAFVPPDVLDNLKSLLVPSGDHQFLLDSSPVAADVKIGGAWKTILVFGERRGGGYYHALDITDTTNPTYLWGFTDTKIVETWSEPIIGKVKMNSATGSTEKYVAIFGGGYDTGTNNVHGKALFVVDVATGTKLWEYSNDGTSDDRQYMNFSIPANPLALDLNNDGYIDKVYIGDVGGQMWKFNLEPAATLTGGTTGTVNNWTGKRFFRAGSDTNPPAAGEYYPTQAIYGSANAALDANRAPWIYFGTGDRNHPNNAAANRFYGIKDETNMTNGSTYTEATSGIVNATTVTAVPTLGWYYLLSSTDKEKVLASADIFNKIVFFTSFKPSVSAACGSGGTARLYAVQMTTAFAALDWATDVAYASSGGSGGGTLSDATKERGENIGSGIPSKPVITLTDTGAQIYTAVVAGKSDGTLSTNPAPPPDNMRRILYWREAF